MPTTLTSTGVQFPDGTTQTTAAGGTPQVVKSVQRGYVGSPSADQHTVNISSVTPSKIMILINGGKGQTGTNTLTTNGDTVGGNGGPTLVSVNSATQFTVGDLSYTYRFGQNLFTSRSQFSWQVIEFY